MVSFDRRKQLVIDNDPNFVPDFDLPVLEFNDNGELILPDVDISQGTKLYSQFSPLGLSSASHVNPPLINLDLRRSSSQASLGIASFGGEGHSQLVGDNMVPMFGDDEELPFADLGLTIDADGNLIEEPELPPHPVQQSGEMGEALDKAPSGALFPEDDVHFFPGDDDFQVMLGGEDQLPVTTQGTMQNNENKVPLPSSEPLSSDPAQQPLQPQQRRKRKRHALNTDQDTYFSREEFAQWEPQYIVRIEGARTVPHNVTRAQAMKNAYNFLFGMGIGDVGILNGVPDLRHELAEMFSGVTLKNRIPGFEEKVAGQGRRRRSASVAFGSEKDEQDDRRVRSRVDEGDVATLEQDAQGIRSHQDAQIIDDDAMAVFGDDQDLVPEAGRERAGSALSDHRRSSNAPWNRPTSAVPSSAAKNVETGRNAVEGSPLVGRGSILQPSDIKFSDGAAPAFGSEGFEPMQHDGAADFSSYSEFGAAAGVSTQEANTSQFMRQALDREGRNFLGFVERTAADRGRADSEDKGLRWVNFDGLFEEQDKTKPVVAQAFLHVLTLATKNQIKVTQDGIEDLIAFGQISIGVAVDLVETAGGDDPEGLEKYKEGQSAVEQIAE